jgi:hypothetical protein
VFTFFRQFLSELVFTFFRQFLSELVFTFFRQFLSELVFTFFRQFLSELVFTFFRQFLSELVFTFSYPESFSFVFELLGPLEVALNYFNFIKEIVNCFLEILCACFVLLFVYAYMSDLKAH